MNSEQWMDMTDAVCQIFETNSMKSFLTIITYLYENIIFLEHRSNC